MTKNIKKVCLQIFCRINNILLLNRCNMSRYKFDNNKMKEIFTDYSEFINSEGSTYMYHIEQSSHHIDKSIRMPLNVKTYSFQDVHTQDGQLFASQITQLQALLQVSKRITDPNVLILNSTQKEMVEMIVENNENAQDEKSKFLRQRAGKYLKIIWKSQKLNDAFRQKWPKIQNIPRYASPIHNFKEIKKAEKKSIRSLSNKNKEAKFVHTNLKKNKSPKQRPKSPLMTQRPTRTQSEDHKFEHISLTPKWIPQKKTPQKNLHERSFESQMTSNLIWKTVNITKQFDNMLKIIRKQI